MPNKTVRSAGSKSTRLRPLHVHTSTAFAALGAFLRLMRAQIRPPAAAAGRRRRATGLRREEVAVRAGISVTWYTWLEQGRPVSVSASTLRAIGSALEADAIQLAHLLELAAAAASDTESALTTTATTAIVNLVNRFQLHAAYAINGLWDVLYANAAAIELLGEFRHGSRVSGNVLRRLFLDDEWRTRFDNWPAIAESAVAQFRVATASCTSHQYFVNFVSQLQRESPDFSDLWNRHQLSNSAAHEKVLRHPERGQMRLAYYSLKPDGAPADVRIILYMPINEQSIVID